MGEISESLINGEFDSITGEYIGKPCGYPRTIHRTGTKPINYQTEVYKLILKKGNSFNISHIQISLIVEQYAHKELKLQQNVKEATVYKHILKDKPRFKAWYLITYPQYNDQS
jgi:hypothetical protein